MNDETKARISKKFQERRTEVSKEIYENIEKLSGLKTLKDAQVNILSLRQRLLEDNYALMESLTTIRKKYRDDKAAEMENLSKNLQIRYQANEKNMVIDGKTSSIKESLEIIENQIAFFTDSIKTIDSIIFGIKARLDIEKTIGL
jgi:hypothetical protein